MKKESKHGENFASDLLEWVNIKKSENDALHMELIDLFNGYPEADITTVYKKIMFMCDLPNGQLKGKLPQLYEIKKKGKPRLDLPFLLTRNKLHTFYYNFTIF